MMKKNHIFILAILLFFGCVPEKKGSDKKPEKIEVSVSNCDFLAIDANDTINTDDETCVKLYLTDKAYAIVNGYIDCPDTTKYTVKTSDSKIQECQKRLYLRNDTIHVCTTPLNEGTLVFNNVKILYMDADSNYFLADTSVTMQVVKSK